MSIMFRCPCGRTMVAESDKTGAIVTCPNCRRSLKVPSGKDRGVEIASAPAATKTRTSRRCLRCGKDVPVDSQICPHCKAIQTDAAAPAPKSQAPAAAAKKAAPAARQASTVVLGGYRGSWWSRLSAAGKTGVLVGILVFVILLVIIGAASYSSWSAGQLQEARDKAQKHLAQGRKLEDQAKFDEAYRLYSYTSIKQPLWDSQIPKDKELADALEVRYVALQYLASTADTRTGLIQWKPKNQEELDQMLAYCRDHYPAYRQLALAIGDAGLEAVQTGQTNPNQPAYEEKVGKVIDAFVILVSKTDERERAQHSFAVMVAAIKELGYANRHWADAKQRNQYLLNGKSRFEGVKEIASKPGYPEGIFQ
jgi:hypothetical protein